MSNLAEENLRTKMKRIRDKIKEQKKLKLSPFPVFSDDVHPNIEIETEMKEMKEMKETLEKIDEKEESEPKTEEPTPKPYFYQRLLWWWK